MKIKIHESYRIVVAVCDSHLIGKKFEEGKKVLEITKPFFDGEEIGEKELVKKMKHFSREDATFNIVGEKSVNSALEAEIIEKEGIQKIEGIPFALVLL